VPARGDGSDYELASTRGEGGDYELAPTRGDGEVAILERSHERPIVVRPSFSQSHNLRNLLAAVAAARALGVTPSGRLDVAFSALRGERVALADGIVLINDCYNANPMSMRAALDDLAASAPARRVAVLGDMLELGPQAADLHRSLVEPVLASGTDLVFCCGPLMRALWEALPDERRGGYAEDSAGLTPQVIGELRAGDAVMVKGSLGSRMGPLVKALERQYPPQRALEDASAQG
jgi:UDP-N-acetylmuramoyl-tripeptide--D-alanyl-D-alanine ligase